VGCFAPSNLLISPECPTSFHFSSPLPPPVIYRLLEVLAEITGERATCSRLMEHYSLEALREYFEPVAGFPADSVAPAEDAE
jgi:hypothetical protein